MPLRAAAQLPEINLRKKGSTQRIIYMEISILSIENSIIVENSGILYGKITVVTLVEEQMSSWKVEEEYGEWICFLGSNSSLGIKKYRGLNSSDGGNIRDRVKIAGGVIGSGDEIEFSEELKEFLPNENGK
ncbi:hypothetical protein Tco_0685961 [Tanacetum coccineum]